MTDEVTTKKLRGSHRMELFIITALVKNGEYDLAYVSLMEVVGRNLLRPILMPYDVNDDEIRCLLLNVLDIFRTLIPGVFSSRSESLDAIADMEFERKRRHVLGENTCFLTSPLRNPNPFELLDAVHSCPSVKVVRKSGYKNDLSFLDAPFTPFQQHDFFETPFTSGQITDVSSIASLLQKDLDRESSMHDRLDYIAPPRAWGRKSWLALECTYRRLRTASKAGLSAPTTFGDLPLEMYLGIYGFILWAPYPDKCHEMEVLASKVLDMLDTRTAAVAGMIVILQDTWSIP